MMYEKLTLAMITYFGSDVRRINHALKVFGFAVTLAEGEGLAGEAREALLGAALLHDIGIHEAERKYQSAAGEYQEKEGPGVASPMLDDAGISGSLKARILFLIGHHHTLNKIDGQDFQLLVESDFLVNAFEDEMKPPAIESVSRKVFRSETGLRLISGMYPL